MNRLLIDFGALYYRELAILKRFYEVYPEINSKSTLCDYTIFNHSDKYITYLLLNRKNYNPLSLIFTKDAQEKLIDIDTIYDDIFSSDKFSKLSYTRTDIQPFINMITAESGIDHITILCKTLEEEQFIRENMKFSNIITELNKDKPYNLYILSDIRYLYNVNISLDSMYYIAKTKYNLVRQNDTYVLPYDFSNSIVNTKISLIELFKITKEYKTKG